MNYLMKRKLPNSIKLINHIMVFFLVYINSLYLFIDKINEYHIYIFSINIFILFAFIITNKTFEIESDKGKWYMREIIWKTWESIHTDHIKSLLYKKLIYKENEEFFNIFKKIYVKRNIIEKDYNELKEVFTKFIPEWLINEVWETGAEKIIPGISIKKHLNIMFLDIIWFTSITEKLAPERALLLLNIYFDWIVEIIKNNWGYIDKFLWDWIMIIFDDKNSDNTIKSAIEIQNYIKKFQINDIWKKISIWIWINSGDVILWTIWSIKRMEITVIWDTVNTASRIEGMTRQLKENILISESTYKRLSNSNSFVINELWVKKLRWKREKIKVLWVESHINMEL
jgi:class 3 adenylate cyclase